MSFNISFLNNHSVSGMEFMDFQQSNFYKSLVDYFDSIIDDKNVIEDVDDSIYPVIEKYTGFKNIEIQLMNSGNLCIDAGYINPSNLFNIENIEDYLPRSESSLYKWFKDNKKQFMHGEIDYKTGKVGGAYADIKFNLMINRNISSYINIGTLNKHNYTPSEVLAGVITHELGHAFGGVSMIHQMVSDNFQVKSAIHFLKKATYDKDRVTIIKDFGRLTDVEQKDLLDADEVARANNENQYLVYFNKLTAQRDANNAAGLGVKQMNSEVIADAYAVRMGCDRALAAGLAALYVASDINFFKMNLLTTVICTLFTGIFVGGIVFTIMYAFKFFSGMTPGDYNSDYRRIMNVGQEQIMRLKQSSELSSADKTAMINQVNQTLKIAKDIKPWYEATAAQRIIGWLTMGGKFKYVDLEFYSQSINSHGVSTLADEINLARGN